MVQSNHYVPQVYLKRFANSDGDVWVFDLLKRKLFKTIPKKMMAENGLYEPRLEAELSAIESTFNRTVERFLHEKNVDEDMIRFLSFMAARTPAFCKQVEQGLTTFLTQKSASEILDTNPMRVCSDLSGEERIVSIDEARRLLCMGTWRVTLDPSRWTEVVKLQAWYFKTQHFPHLHWFTLTAPEGRRFVTSDRPLSWASPNRGIAYEPALFKESDVELLMPIDPKRCMLGLGARPDSDSRPLFVDVNARLIQLADRFVLGQCREDVEFAQVIGSKALDDPTQRASELN